MLQSWLEGIMVPVERRKKFYVDWGINPAYILALLSAVLSALVWAGDVNRNQAVTNETLKQHAVEDAKTEKRVDRLETQFDERLIRMEAKQDKMLEMMKRQR